MNRYRQYQTLCSACGRLTTRSFAHKHDGHCALCVHGRDIPTREERIIDAGYEAYAREEGHYDTPDNY